MTLGWAVARPLRFARTGTVDIIRGLNVLRISKKHVVLKGPCLYVTAWRQPVAAQDRYSGSNVDVCDYPADSSRARRRLSGVLEYAEGGGGWHGGMPYSPRASIPLIVRFSLSDPLGFLAMSVRPRTASLPQRFACSR